MTEQERRKEFIKKWNLANPSKYRAILICTAVDIVFLLLALTQVQGALDGSTGSWVLLGILLVLSLCLGVIRSTVVTVRNRDWETHKKEIQEQASKEK